MEISHWVVLILPSVLFQGTRGQDSVKQTKALEINKEGEESNFECQYNTSNFNGLHWYRQYPGEGPTFLLMLILEKPENKDNFHGKLDKKNRKSHLSIRGVRFIDAATYFCAPTTGINKVIFGKGTKLLVWPNIPDSPPSVYKLKPSTPEKEGKAACLFTDYSPNPLKVGIQKEDEKKAVNGSVVVVKEEDAEKGTGSYGIVLWGNDDESFSCTASYKEEQSIEASSEGSSTCSQEGAENVTFETDERLNLLSFTVLGLRVIFLKSVAFNLLFTFRLWSR